MGDPEINHALGLSVPLQQFLMNSAKSINLRRGVANAAVFHLLLPFLGDA